MTEKKSNSNLKIAHEKAINYVKDVVKNRLSGQISNVKDMDESLSVNGTITDCEKLLEGCKDRLMDGSFSNEYSAKESLRQQQEIRDIKSKLNEHAHNLHEHCDTRGFAFFG